MHPNQSARARWQRLICDPRIITLTGGAHGRGTFLLHNVIAVNTIFLPAHHTTLSSLKQQLERPNARIFAYKLPKLTRGARDSNVQIAQTRASCIQGVLKIDSLCSGKIGEITENENALTAWCRTCIFKLKKIQIRNWNRASSKAKIFYGSVVHVIFYIMPVILFRSSKI